MNSRYDWTAALTTAAAASGERDRYATSMKFDFRDVRAESPDATTLHHSDGGEFSKSIRCSGSSWSIADWITTGLMRISRWVAIVLSSEGWSATFATWSWSRRTMSSFDFES